MRYWTLTLATLCLCAVLMYTLVFKHNSDRYPQMVVVFIVLVFVVVGLERTTTRPHFGRESYGLSAWVIWCAVCLIGGIWWYTPIAWGLLLPIFRLHMIEWRKTNNKINRGVYWLPIDSRWIKRASLGAFLLYHNSTSITAMILSLKSICTWASKGNCFWYDFFIYCYRWRWWWGEECLYFVITRSRIVNCYFIANF